MREIRLYGILNFDFYRSRCLMRARSLLIGASFYFDFLQSRKRDREKDVNHAASFSLSIIWLRPWLFGSALSRRRRFHSSFFCIVWNLVIYLQCQNASLFQNCVFYTSKIGHAIARIWNAWIKVDWPDRVYLMSMYWATWAHVAPKSNQVMISFLTVHDERGSNRETKPTFWLSVWFLNNLFCLPLYLVAIVVTKYYSVLKFKQKHCVLQKVSKLHCRPYYIAFV